MSVKSVKDEVPDELPDRTPRRGRRVEGVIKFLGFAEPLPSQKEFLEKNGAYTKAQFLEHVEPLNIKMETDPEYWEYETNFGNDICSWLDYRNGNGEIKGPNSFFGIVKTAYEAITGKKLRSSEDYEALIGKKFVFWWGPPEIEGVDNVKTWVLVPEAELSDDYEFSGERKPVYRPQRFGEGKTPTVALAEEVMESLVDALDGVESKKYIGVIAKAKLPKDAQKVIVNEATKNGGAALTKRMLDSGLMKLSAGKLVRA